VAYFLVGYQLKHGSELARRRFCDELERLGGVEALDRLYLIELDGMAREVRDYLCRYLADTDSLIIVEFDKPPETTASLTGTEPWIEDRFSLPVENGEPRIVAREER
jgi:hypothetical protein